MHYNPFQLISEEIRRLKNLDTQQRRINRMAAIKLKDEVLAALSFEDAVKLVFKKCPSYGELIAFTALLRNDLTSLADLQEASDRAKLFSAVSDSNDIDGTTLTKRMKDSIDTLDDIYRLAIHPDSQDGTGISVQEYDLLNNYHIKIGFILADHSTMIDRKFKASQKRKQQ